MKIEPFKENLNHKVIPMAQSILVKSGNHIPMLLSYDKNGIEKISDLSDLFSVTDKDILYGILGSFLDESDSVAYILVTEAWKKKVEKDMISDAQKSFSRAANLLGGGAAGKNKN